MPSQYEDTVISMAQPQLLNDFCATCSTYLADASICPTCGTLRLRSGEMFGDEVEVLATLPISGDVEPGAVAVGSLLLAPITMKSEEGSAYARVLAIDLAPVSERWHFDLPHEFISPPLVVAKDLLIFATQSRAPLARDGGLHALALESGREQWRWGAGLRALSAPCLVDGALRAVGDDNVLWEIDVTSGEVIASVELGEGARHILAPAAIDDLLLIPTRSAEVVAVNRKTRRVAWRYRHQSGTWSGAPLVVGDVVIVPFSDGGVVALSPERGELRWQHRVQSQSPPLASDGRRLFVGERRGVVALDVSDGTPLWRMESERRVTAPPLLYLDTLLVAGHDHVVRALDTVSGEERWRWEGDRRFEVSPLLTPEGLALLDAGDKLTLLKVPLTQPSLDTALAMQAWRVAATRLARDERLVEAAELLESHGDAYAAAEMWLAAGDESRAASLYEQADTELGWQKAAALWERLGMVEARAVALQRLAELRDDVEAWMAARLAYQEAGLRKEAAACWREICRLRKYPFIRIEVAPEAGFVKGEYNILKLQVTNEGYGVARMLSARATGPFSGEDMQSRAIGNLASGHATELQLALMPTEAGRVPLNLEVSFLLGRDGEPHTVSARAIVPVAASRALSHSAEEWRDQYNDAFRVTPRDDFRRAAGDIIASYQRQLQDLQARLLSYREYKTRYGILAPPEIAMEIARMEEEKAVLEKKLDALLAEE